MKSTACLSAAVESTPKSFPVKTWPVKSLPGKKGLNFLPPRCILHNVGHPGGNAESLIFPDEFLNFSAMNLAQFTSAWGNLLAST